MTAIPDHYAALGIDPTADQEVIAAAYRALAKKYHPDTGATTGTASAERFAEIQQAYEVLGSPEGRRRYDEELLEATQRELDEHLAKKQRKLAGSTAEPPPPPDLGVIRPTRPMGKPSKLNVRSSIREMGPFLVVSGLLMAVGVGFASLLIRQGPPPPLVEEAALPKPPQMIEDPAPPKPAEPASTPAPAPAPKSSPQQQAALPEQKPLFGTSMMDEPAAAVASPDTEAEAAARGDLPAPATTVPVPRAKPQTVAAEQPEAVAEARSSGRFAVVIYEKYRSGDVIEEQARLVFSSEDRCAAFGERTVLRRLAPYEGQRQRPRIWYECNEIP